MHLSSCIDIIVLLKTGSTPGLENKDRVLISRADRKDFLKSDVILCYF